MVVNVLIENVWGIVQVRQKELNQEIHFVKAKENVRHSKMRKDKRDAIRYYKGTDFYGHHVKHRYPKDIPDKEEKNISVPDTAVWAKNRKAVKLSAFDDDVKTETENSIRNTFLLYSGISFWRKGKNYNHTTATISEWFF